MAKGSVNFFPVNHDPWADLPKGPTEARQGPMSWTDYLPFVKEAIKIYGKEKLGEMLGAVTAPGDALAGKLDPGTPEGLKRVQALASLAMSGPSKPQGAVGAGWQFPAEKFLSNYEKGIYSPEINEIAGMMIKSKISSPKEAAEYLGKHHDIAKELEKSFVGKAEYGYKHPHNEPFTSHPATYGMNEQEARAAGEILEAVKNFPEQYPTVADAMEGLGSYVEPHELQHFESAAKKLQDWSGEHGFKFEEPPNLIEETKSFLAQIKKENAKFANVQHQTPPAYTPPKTIPIEEALYPINWADLHSAVRRPGQEATGQYAETLRRAEALGFNTNFPIYHGAFETKVKAPANPSEGIWGPQAEKYHSFGDPKEMKGAERGIFTADTPEIAAQYSGGSVAEEGRGQIFPLFANPKKTLAVDWTAVSGNPSYGSMVMNKLIEAAHKREADALVIQGMQDMGGPQNQYVFLRPNVLRSQFAMFDPKKVDSPNLLHSGGLGAAPLFIPVDHNPFEEPAR